MNNYPITFKCCSKQDLETACDLYKVLCDHLQKDAYSPLWRYGIYPDENMITEAIENKELYLGTVNGKAVCVFRLIEHPEHVSFHLFGIHPQFRHTGCSVAALNFVDDEVRRKGYRKIVLDVIIGNMPAEKLYEHNGYVYTCETSIHEEDQILNFHNYEKVLG